MKIIVLNGEGTTGKDTFCEMLESFCSVYKYSTIDMIKDIAKEHFDWDGKKNEKGRQLLSDLKSASVKYNDKIYNNMIEAITKAEQNNYDLFVVMIREIPEIEKLTKDVSLKDNVITILVTSDRIKNHFKNVSDSNVYNFIYDYYIDNNGTLDDLKESAHSLLTDLCIC